MTRILVVKLSSLGDLFHILPAVRCLKRGLTAEIDWVTQPEYTELVRCFSDVGEIILFPRQRFLTQAIPFWNRLRRQHYDVVIDFQGLIKSALLVSRCARGARRIGPSYSREGARLFHAETTGRPDKNRHAVEEALDVARYLDLPIGEPEFPVSFPPRRPAEPSPRVAFIPCSRWPAKNWPAEQFIELGNHLQQQKNASVFIIGGPDGVETGRRIEAGLSGRVVNLCGRTSLVEMGSILAGMNLVVSVDSGPMHVAAAVGVPVLAIFGVTDPVRTGPYGKRHRVILARAFQDHPELARAYKKKNYAGLWQVPTGEVVQHAMEMLA